ncbi:MAG: hypothetical protein FJ137_04570 [Deltaproteobacteria bacterium]|nr:hypothetical protein [Deltaproteobacteria bacterium]
MVGHAYYGADSLEAHDMRRRADVALRRFRAALEQRVGRQSVVLAVTADHSGPPLPQGMRAHGLDEPSIQVETIVAAAERVAAAVLATPTTATDKGKGKGEGKNEASAGDASSSNKPRVQGLCPPQLFVAAAVRGIPGVARVYDLRQPADRDDACGPLMRASAPPGRAARLVARQAPRVVFLDTGGRDLGSDHGAPYAHDRRVPLLLRGPGIARGRFAARADARDVAATLAFVLGVSPPDASMSKVVGAVDPR